MYNVYALVKKISFVTDALADPRAAMVCFFFFFLLYAARLHDNGKWERGNGHGKTGWVTGWWCVLKIRPFRSGLLGQQASFF